MAAIAWPYSRSGGLIAASTFAVLHCADGVAQAGQRDFQVAVLLLAGTACLFSAFRHSQPNRKHLGIFIWGSAQERQPPSSLNFFWPARSS